jgi:hypothetical protein
MTVGNRDLHVQRLKGENNAKLKTEPGQAAFIPPDYKTREYPAGEYRKQISAYAGGGDQRGNAVQQFWRLHNSWNQSPLSRVESRREGMTFFDRAEQAAKILWGGITNPFI